MLNIEVLYNDNDEEVYCTFSKERIELGEKFAYLIIQTYNNEVEKLPYKLENLPESQEFDDELFVVE